MLDRNILRLAGTVMAHPLDYKWTVQGFGMIRTYLDDAKQWRLNVWDNRLRVIDVSDIHDHPWSFRSWVLCGQIRNTRYQPVTIGTPGAMPFQHVRIITGEGGGPMGNPIPAWLKVTSDERYEGGQGYHQERTEIHRTEAYPGTITLNDRTPATREHTADIYWEHGPWINAEPRAATKAEIYSAVEQAAYQAKIARWQGMTP